MACQGPTSMFVKGMKVLENRQKIEVKHIALFYQHYNAKKNDLKKKINLKCSKQALLPSTAL